MNKSKAIEGELDFLSTEARDLYLGSVIPELFELPCSMQFMRDYVSKNRPVIIRSATLNWPAISKWNSKYFRTTLANKAITVARTPNGYADGLAIHPSNGREYFVMPEEKQMQMNDFLDSLDTSRLVHYIQRQNSNFMEDFPELMDDIDRSLLNFAGEAFNKEPDAVNFWMGDQRAITSLHKDPYENIYCVIAGYKDFILIPPVDLHYVPRATYPTALYKTNGNDDNILSIDPIVDDNKKPVNIEWVSIDPLAPDLKKYPTFTKAAQFQVRVNAGDILYLPNLWYHHVRQSHKCISVNFWYDMEYDARYCYYRMMEKIFGYGN